MSITMQDEAPVITTIAGVPIARAYTRIVHGKRGDYVEFSDDQMIKENMAVPKDQEWRLHTDKRYYIEYRTPDGVKIYFQKQYVGYADYKIGFYYIAPRDLDLVLPSKQTPLDAFLKS